MKILNQIIRWLIVVLIFLLPLFFLPVTAEFYLFNKQTLLFVATGILFLLWAVKMVFEKTITFRKTPLDLPIILFLIAHLLATFLASPNKVEAMTGSTSTGTILALTALYFVITNNLDYLTLRFSLLASITSAALLGLTAIYQFLGLGEVLASIPWFQELLFTPAGHPLILISFLISNLVLGVILFLRKFSRQEWLLSAFLFVPCLLIALGLGLTVHQILPGKETSLAFLPYQDSWAIAIEAFKRNPLLGVGPSNFPSAFNRFRPVSFNTYQFWNTRFAQSANFPLELLTTGGVITLGAYLFLIIRALGTWLAVYRQGKAKDSSLALSLGLLALLIIHLVLPINLLTLVFTFLFLSLLTVALAQKEVVSLPGKALSLVILGVTVILIGVSFYGWGRIYAADLYFRRSLDSLAKNQGLPTYNNQVQAIRFNPYSSTYRRAYSQTNFALANSLAGKPELSDQDRSDITQLIQQAIREAKAATALNPTRADNWENLAQIYRSLINFAQGADQWAVAAYRQAILTDPVNPRIRLNLGGLFYSLQDFETATRQFQNAVDLKPDYANGYYNLAAAYRERKMYQEAHQAMQIVVDLVPADSADSLKAKGELEELAKKLPAEATPAARPVLPKIEEALTEPEPLPSPVITPPIELPGEAGPTLPAGSPELSPAPSPTQETPIP